jgi:4-aminobutyrate aminotransferase
MAALIARGNLNVVSGSSIGHFTHEKSPIGAAAALATLDVIEEEALLNRSESLGLSVLTRLSDMAKRHPEIREARGVGMLWGVELDGDSSVEQAEAVLYACLSRGLSFKVSSGTVLTLSPPLTISDDEMNQALGILAEAFAEVLD